MRVIPAIDIRGGRAVRLTKGDFDQETVYSDDPVAVARSFAQAGADRVHVVDLDAARGSGDNREAIRAIVAGAGVAVQVAGGVRDLDRAQALLEFGAAAVVVGTTAVRAVDDFLAIAAAHPGQVFAALDLKGGEPAVTGWDQTEPIALGALLQRWEAGPLAGVILTAVDRDGTLLGPDLAALSEVKKLTRHHLVYSGGIGSLEDISTALAAGAEAVIVGKSIYEGRLDLRAALAL